MLEVSDRIRLWKSVKYSSVERKYKGLVLFMVGVGVPFCQEEVREAVRRSNLDVRDKHTLFKLLAEHDF